MKLLRKTSGFVGNCGQVNHSASRARIFGATLALALEMGKRRITVNCVAPGIVETDMVEDAPIDVIKNDSIKNGSAKQKK